MPESRPRLCCPRLAAEGVGLMRLWPELFRQSRGIWAAQSFQQRA
jgi:hypothetical protein